MAQLQYTNDARQDLRQIATYTTAKWGQAQAFHYVGQLRAACRRLTAYPLLGSACDHLRLGLRRTVHGSHVIFYRQTAGGIRIVRILHQAMSSSQHILGDH